MNKSFKIIFIAFVIVALLDKLIREFKDVLEVPSTLHWAVIIALPILGSLGIVLAITHLRKTKLALLLLVTFTLPLILVVLKFGGVYLLSLQGFVGSEYQGGGVSLKTLQKVTQCAMTDTTACKRETWGKIAYGSWGVQIAYKDSLNRVCLYKPDSLTSEKWVQKSKYAEDVRNDREKFRISKIPFVLVYYVFVYFFTPLILLVRREFNLER